MRIDTAEQLRSLLGHPSELVMAKVHDHLSPQACDFIARSPLVILATANRDGMPTASPKGDVPGFVHTEGTHTLYLPERRGNKLLSSFLNLLENPRLGLIFLVPGCVETLRVSGTAELLDDPELASRLMVQNAPALLTVKLRVTEAYFHCGKAFIRSNLWKAETWPTDFRVSLGREIGANLGKDATFAADIDAQVQQRYCDSLY